MEDTEAGSGTAIESEKGACITVALSQDVGVHTASYAKDDVHPNTNVFWCLTVGAEEEYIHIHKNLVKILGNLCRLYIHICEQSMDIMPTLGMRYPTKHRRRRWKWVVEESREEDDNKSFARAGRCGLDDGAKEMWSIERWEGG